MRLHKSKNDRLILFKRLDVILNGSIVNLLGQVESECLSCNSTFNFNRINKYYKFQVKLIDIV